MGAPLAGLRGVTAARGPHAERAARRGTRRPLGGKGGGTARVGWRARGPGGGGGLLLWQVVSCSGAAAPEPVAHMSIVFCLVPKRLFRRPITLLWIWQTRLSVRFSISPISRMVWPTW